MIKEADGKFYKVGDDGQPLTDKNGDIIYYTKDNKYTYSDADSQVLGHNAPKWTMGFQNSFTYKNFDFNITRSTAKCCCICFFTQLPHTINFWSIE